MERTWNWKWVGKRKEFCKCSLSVGLSSCPSQIYHLAIGKKNETNRQWGPL